MLHAAIASCNAIKSVAKKVLSSFVKYTAFSATTLALHLQRQLCHCICSDNFGTALAATTLALHLQRQFCHCICSDNFWHCICSDNFGTAFAARTLKRHFGTAFAATTLTLHLQRQLWHSIWSDNLGTAFAATTLALHLQRQLWHCIPSDNFGSAFTATTLELHLSKCYGYCGTQYIQRDHIHNSENIAGPENTLLQIWTIQSVLLLHQTVLSKRLSYNNQLIKFSIVLLRLSHAFIVSIFG